MNPAFRMSENLSRSLSVKPGFPGLVFVVLFPCGLAISISSWATFRSPQNITGLSRDLMCFRNCLSHFLYLKSNLSRPLFEFGVYTLTR